MLLLQMSFYSPCKKARGAGGEELGWGEEQVLNYPSLTGETCKDSRWYTPGAFRTFVCFGVVYCPGSALTAVANVHAVDTGSLGFSKTFWGRFEIHNPPYNPAVLPIDLIVGVIHFYEGWQRLAIDSCSGYRAIAGGYGVVVADHPIHRGVAEAPGS